MTKPRSVFDNLKRLWSLIVGLRVTGSNYVQPQITVHYPRKTVGDSVKSFRGHIELIGKPKQPEVPKCICCMLCVTSCPSSCIKVIKMKEPKPPKSETEAPKEMAAPQPKKNDPPKKKPVKTPSKWTVDFNLCSLCGTCVEVCPVKSLRFSSNSYLAGYDSAEFKYDLLADLKKKAGSKAGESKD